MAYIGLHLGQYIRLIDDQTGVMDLEAAGGTGRRQVEHH